MSFSEGYISSDENVTRLQCPVEISNLLDGKGYVRLIDTFPRFNDSSNLPFNFYMAIFKIKAPLFMMVHFMNIKKWIFDVHIEFETIPDYYNPMESENGIREIESNTSEAYGLEHIPDALDESIQSIDLYSKMVSTTPLAKDIAFMFLPMNTYVIFNVKVDHFIFEGTIDSTLTSQMEFQIYVSTMTKLTKGFIMQNTKKQKLPIPPSILTPPKVHMRKIPNSTPVNRIPIPPQISKYSPVPTK